VISSKLNPNSVVLHIHSVPSPHAEDLDSRLAAASLDVKDCGDVYRALARLARSDVSRFRAVFVCLDGLDPYEFEFFSLVARLQRDLPVYVYAGPRSDSRVQKALDLGAAGRVTTEVIDSLAPAHEDRVASDEEVAEPQMHAAPDAAPPPPALAKESPIAAQETEPVPDERDEEHGKVEGGTVQGSVRVPWLRYEGRPARTAPKPPDRPAQPAPEPETEAHASGVHRPLLTEEELQALIGDDISSVAPDNPQTNRNDETAGGGTKQ
jgi:hypothetical protein